MACFDTPENGRAAYTRQTLESLTKTVDFSKHRIFIIVNGGTEETHAAIAEFGKQVGTTLEVIYNQSNIGTARAINKAWAHRKPGEMCIKMDNDVVIHQARWIEEMEEAIQRMPKIGIIGLKRKDLAESPTSKEPQFRSQLMEVPHAPGQNNLYVEVVQHVMGTCHAFNPALLDKIGYLCQPGVYGYDDSLAAVRCTKAGFFNCFLLGVQIDHIDPGGDPYTAEKQRLAWDDHAEYNRIKDGIRAGTIPVYCGVDGVLGEPVTTSQTGWSHAAPNYILR